MNAFWCTIRSYVFWQHERGTLHYDIMVTLILIFVFFSPYWINFNDKPTARIPHPTDVVVTPDVHDDVQGNVHGRLLYQISASSIKPGDDQSIQEQLRRVIAPISGEVSIVHYDTVTDSSGRVQSYRVLAQR